MSHYFNKGEEQKARNKHMDIHNTKYIFTLTKCKCVVTKVDPILIGNYAALF